MGTATDTIDEIPDLSDMPLERLEAELCQGAANLTAAEHTWLLQLAEFDRRLGWELWGCNSCVHWLVWQVGLDARTARDKVRVAQALTQFPLISSAMRLGHLSYSKVRAITRVVVAETEHSLVDMALAGTTNHVERIVAAYRRATPKSDGAHDHAAHDRAAWAGRGLTHRLNDNGTITITMTVPTEPGVAFLSAVETFAAPPTPDVDGHILSRQARLADAAVAMAEVAVAAEDGERLSSAPRFLVQLHVGEGMCEIDGIGDSVGTPLAVSPATAERLSCDAYAERVLHASNGEVSGISSRASVIRGRLRRLILARDRCCTVPGCGRRGRAEIHHFQHRGKGGTNSTVNLGLTCRYHHHLLHEGGWIAVGTDEGIEFHLPDGRIIRPTPTLTTGNDSDVAAHGRGVDDGRCQWIGDRLDLDMALTCLFSEQPWIDPWRFPRTAGPEHAGRGGPPGLVSVGAGELLT
ncbi:MAG: hypothetical protein F2681_01920 [Actinobacteria bacterium]|nr:hypothetical protein [Actinomycetota bacterium]MSW76172.1 hypothetical protein [Actinomycetota bacterium]MSZ81882.1 hypothetical protein [Actinomycetota bacterium]MTB16721.1 hypothetical protein [Actinomycetota bacterium]